MQRPCACAVDDVIAATIRRRASRACALRDGHLAEDMSLGVWREWIVVTEIEGGGHTRATMTAAQRGGWAPEHEARRAHACVSPLRAQLPNDGRHVQRGGIQCRNASDERAGEE